MSRAMRLVVAVLAAGTAFGVIGGVFVAGYARGHPNFQADAFVRSVLARVGVARETDPEPAPLLEEHYESTLVTLKGDLLRVPVDRHGAGGGLTSLGDKVLLLTHEGRLFASAGPDTVVEIEASIPDNGYEAFVRAAELPVNDALEFRPEYLRYNDILYYESGERTGLAISYTEYVEEDACYRNVIATLDLDPEVRSAVRIQATAADWVVVFRTEPCLPLKPEFRALEGHMAGGRMAFRKPSTLFLASGDYHWDGMYASEAIAQQPEWNYGKVIQIDLASGEARTVSAGHRNPQGVTLDGNGDLWVVEHGPRGGDELNRILPGRDYGWPTETLGTQYNGLPWPRTVSDGRHEGSTPPVYAWLPSVAPSGLDLIDGFYGPWGGDLIMATLSAQSLYRLRIREGRVKFAEPIHIGKRVRYVHQHSDGRLVLWTDSRELVFLSIAERGAELRFLEERIATAHDSAQAVVVSRALAGCMECHSIVRDIHSNAPSLASVYGEPIAGSNFDGYSEALLSLEGRWTREALLAYLRDPGAVAPGTTMPGPGYDDPTILEALVELLDALNNPTDSQ